MFLTGFAQTPQGLLVPLQMVVYPEPLVVGIECPKLPKEW